MKNVLFLLLILAVLAGCKKKRPIPLSSVKTITSFSIRTFQNPSLVNDIYAEIIDDTIYIDVPASIDLSSLKPSISFSGKSIDPLPGLPQNFNNTIFYAVTAEDGSTKKYKTKTRILSSQKQINSFVFTKTANPSLPSDLTAVITGDTITITLPPGLTTNNLIPSITFLGTAMNPQGGQPANFSTPVQYTVTAADGTTRTYTVFTSANTDVLVQGADLYLYNINAINGSLKWRFYTGAQSVPTCHNGVVFANGADGVIYAINLADGKLKWKSAPPKGRFTLTIPSVKYGKVFCSFTGSLIDSNSILHDASFVFALNEETGTTEWMSKLAWNSSILTNVTVDDNIVLFFDSKVGKIVLNANDGSLSWEIRGEMLVQENPVIYDGNIYACDEGLFLSFTETGQMRWFYRIFSRTCSVYNGIIYTLGNGLMGFNTNGTLISTIPLFAERRHYAPVFCSNMAILTDSYHELRAYSLTGGAILWERKNFNWYPVAANNEVFISDVAGAFHSLDAATGKSKWSFNANTSFNQAACIVDSKNATYHTPESGETN